MKEKLAVRLMRIGLFLMAMNICIMAYDGITNGTYTIISGYSQCIAVVGLIIFILGMYYGMIIIYFWF